MAYARGLASVLTGAVLSACAQLPHSDAMSTQGEEWIQTLNAQCEQAPAEDALMRAAPDERQREFARKVSALETLLTRKPMVAGNRATLLMDGPATHAAQLAAIAEAQHHVHLDVYILTDQALGQRYAEALAAKARAGVKVRVMFDAVGAISAGFIFRQELRNAGVELVEANPVNPLKDFKLWRMSSRSHRKLLVVDGRVAFTGGINISEDYAESSLGSSGGVGWRDTHLKIEGPAVAQFQELFFENWQKARGPISPSAHYWPQAKNEGADLVRVVTQNGKDLSEVALWPVLALWRGIWERKLPKVDPHAVYGSYLAAIREARQSIWITQAYFAPSDDFLDLLREAAGRGVDVRILVPGRSDVGLLLHASRSFYSRLLKSGVRIHEYQGPMLHAKTAVVDGVWATVGSSNLDFRSFIHNDEANAIVIGAEFGAQMRAMFENDLARASEITLSAWRERGWWRKLREKSAAAFKYWI